MHDCTSVCCWGVVGWGRLFQILRLRSAKQSIQQAVVASSMNGRGQRVFVASESQEP